MRLIDAKRLLREIEIDKYGNIQTTINGLMIAMGRSEVEAEPVKHGRWREYNYPGQECVYCSACKTEYYPDDLIVIGVNDYPYYCPNCGAKMNTEEGEAHEQN